MSADIVYKNYPKSENFDISTHPMYWVAIMNAQYLQTMEKDLKPMGLDIARWRIAMILRTHGKMRVSKISQLAVNRLSTTTKLIQRMKKDGFLTSQKHHEDDRVILISLTPKGHMLLDATLEKTHYIFLRIFDGIPAADLTVLIDTLQKMHANLAK